jgi:hypothetical protein
VNERVSDVVERFGRLTSREQTEAYLEVEENLESSAEEL